jgi:hypothetical protein
MQQNNRKEGVKTKNNKMNKDFKLRKLRELFPKYSEDDLKDVLKNHLDNLDNSVLFLSNESFLLILFIYFCYSSFVRFRFPIYS